MISIMKLKMYFQEREAEYEKAKAEKAAQEASSSVQKKSTSSEPSTAVTDNTASQSQLPKVTQDLSQIKVEPQFIDDDIKPLDTQEVDELDEDFDDEEEEDESDMEEDELLKEADFEEVKLPNNKSPEKSLQDNDSTKSSSSKKSKKRKSNSDKDLDTNIEKLSPKKKQKFSETQSSKKKSPGESVHKRHRELNKWAKSLPKYKSLKASRSGLFQVSDKNATEVNVKEKSAIAKGKNLTYMPKNIYV